MTLLAAFATLLPQILTDFLETAIFAYAEGLMNALSKPLACDRCGNDQGVIWTTKQGKPAKILTTFQCGLHPLQVQCGACGHKFYLTRRILGPGVPRTHSKDGLPETGLNRGAGVLSRGHQDRQHLRLAPGWASVAIMAAGIGCFSPAWRP